MAASTKMRFSGWRRCPAWEWTPRNRSLPKSAIPRRPYPIGIEVGFAHSTVGFRKAAGREFYFFASPPKVKRSPVLKMRSLFFTPTGGLLT